MPTINFINDVAVQEDAAGLTLLQISEKHSIPHMHVCGGMARCSTCRVLVVEHPENLSPATPQEKKLAEKLGFDANIRLACQARVNGPVTVRRLTLDDADASLDCAMPEQMTGREAKLAILFSDIRGFTSFTEQALPYDVVHVLNRYFFLMGDAILASNGYIDKYIGDGIMALFGVTCSNGETNCRNALNAALRMLEELDALNVYLKRNFNTEFKIGIGIHYGDAVIGELGHPRRRQITAIGDAVNMASRIESATKEFGAPLLVSDTVVAQLQGKIELGRSFSAMLKGKSGVYALYEALGLCDETTELNRDAALRRRLNHALRPVITVRCAPLLLRAAFHEAGTFNLAEKSGGANGTLRLPEVYSRPEHKGMAAVVEWLAPVKERFAEVSWADLFLYAGAAAVKVLGGPDISIALGRTDSDVVPAEGALLLGDFSIQQLKAHFARMGLGARELVALTGSHTVGRVDGVPMTEDWFRFNNRFFQALLAGGAAAAALLPTDRALLEDEECSTWVRQYAADEHIFFDDFAKAYTAMSLLGSAL